MKKVEKSKIGKAGFGALLAVLLTACASTDLPKSSLATSAQSASKAVAAAPVAASVPSEQRSAQTATPTPSLGSTALPDGVTTEKNPLKQKYIDKTHGMPAFFRPNPNMPDLFDEDLLQGWIKGAKPKNPKGDRIVAYMPKLKVLPCPVGCVGEDYDKAVAAFIKGFEGFEDKGEKTVYERRGEMIVQVRWFHVRPWYQHFAPYGSNVFGVQFMLEGKLVSIGAQSGIGGYTQTNNVREIAHDLGAKIGFHLLVSLGVGRKPMWIDTANDVGKGLVGKMGDVATTLGSVFGETDVRSRVEPATADNDNLLPAIDGIRPNEVEPIAGMHYIFAAWF